MKNVYHLFTLVFLALFTSASAQQVTKTYNPAGSVTIDNVGDYGTALSSVNFTSSDFGLVWDVRFQM